MIETIIPKNEEEWLQLRVQDITSTEAAALFGLSPYTTYFELWHRKKNQQYFKIDPNERMELGTALQDAIAEYIANKEGWKVRRMPEYMRDTEIGAGSSFDFMIEGVLKEDHLDDTQVGLLEIKNVDNLVYKNDWIADDTGSPQAPVHIEIQVQHQMLVSGLPFTWLGACVGGNHIEKFKRTPDPRIQNALREKIFEFWKSIEEDREPLPNYAEDAGYINSMFSFAEPGKIVEVTDGDLTALAFKHVELGEQENTIKKAREEIKAKILMGIGDAEKAIGPGYSIDAGVTGSSQRNFIMPAFRRFRVFPKKTK